MKLRNLLQRTAAAAVAGAMALSLSAPALAETWNLSNLQNVDQIRVYIDEDGNQRVRQHIADSGNWVTEKYTPPETSKTIITGSNSQIEKIEIWDGASVTLQGATFGQQGGKDSGTSQPTVSVTGDAELKLEGNNTIYGGNKGISVSSGTLKVTGDGSLTTYGYGYNGIENYNGSVTAGGSAKLNIRDSNSSKSDLGENIVKTDAGYTGQVKYYTSDAETPYLVLPKVDYGITVTYGNGDEVKVTSENMDSILGILQYDPETNTLSNIGQKAISGDLTIVGNNAVDVKLEAGAVKWVVTGNLTITDARNVTVLKNSSGTYSEDNRLHAIRGDANIECSGDLVIENGTKYGRNAVAAVNGKLTAKVGGNVTIEGALSNDADITTSGNVTMNCVNGNAVNVAEGKTLTVTGANDINVSAYAEIGTVSNVILNNCTGTAVFKNTLSNYPAITGSLTVNSDTATYYYAGSSESNVPKQSSAAECLNKKYVRVVMNDADVTEYGITVNGTSVTNKNCNDILADLPDVKGKLVYNDETHTLTSEGRIVPANEDDDIKLEIKISSGKDIDVSFPEGVTASELTITGAHDVTATGTGIPTLAGKTNITCTGNVNITSTGGMGMAVFNGLTVTGAQDVTVTGNGSGPAVSGNVDITCTGDVNITSTDGMAVAGTLTVTNAKSVTVNANDKAPAVNGKVTITNCVGEVKITNKGYVIDQRFKDALEVNGAKSVVLHSEGENDDPTVVGNVTIKNCTDAVEITNSKERAVAGKLTITNDSPTDTSVTITGSGNSSTVAQGATITNCTGNVEITNNSGMAIGRPDDGSAALTVEGAKDVKITGNGGNPAIDFDAIIKCSGDVEITNDSGMAVGGTLTVDGAEDVTVKANDSSPAIGGVATITCSGDVEITNNNGAATGGTLSYTNSGNSESKKVVRHDGKFRSVLDSPYYSVSAPNVSSITLKTEEMHIVTATGFVISENRAEFYAGEEVTVKATEYDNDPQKQFSGWIVKTDEAETYHEPKFDGALPYFSFIMPDSNVTVTAVYKAKTYPVSITGGKVTKLDGEAVDAAPGTIAYGTTVTIEADEPEYGYVFKQWTSDDVTVEDATSAKTTFTMPAGKVTIKAEYERIESGITITNGKVTKLDGEAVDAAPGTIAYGTTVTIEADGSDAGYVLKKWNASWTDANGEEQELPIENNTFKMPAGDVTITAVTEETLPVDPDNPGNPDLDPDFGTDPVDDGSGAAGAIVAGTLIGGAAIWGGYEITTRVILNDLLPEGAAIPANRGQLAALIWAEKGKPEPAAQPAFTDVADAGLAKAAQWCVEQGLLDAKDGKFDPDGWTPKFRVIEVWKKAFPNQ